MFIYFKLLIIQQLQLLKELAELKRPWESHHKGKALRIVGSRVQRCKCTQKTWVCKEMYLFIATLLGKYSLGKHFTLLVLVDTQWRLKPWSKGT